MTTEPSWGDRAVQMTRSGRTLTSISRELEVEWLEVFRYVREVQGTDWSTWVGAKRIITRRLKSMAASNDPEKREHLRVEVADAVDYLHTEAKRLRDKIDRARKSLEY